MLLAKQSSEKVPRRKSELPITDTRHSQIETEETEAQDQKDDKKELGKLDQAYEKATAQLPAFANLQAKRYLIFRPYIDPMSIRPYKPADKGYYFKFYNSAVQLIRYTLEDNGFREATERDQEWSVMWACSNIKV